MHGANDMDLPEKPSGDHRRWVHLLIPPASSLPTYGVTSMLLFCALL